MSKFTKIMNKKNNRKIYIQRVNLLIISKFLNKFNKEIMLNKPNHFWIINIYHKNKPINKVSKMSSDVLKSTLFMKTNNQFDENNLFVIKNIIKQLLIFIYSYLFNYIFNLLFILYPNFYIQLFWNFYILIYLFLLIKNIFKFLLNFKKLIVI